MIKNLGETLNNLKPYLRKYLTAKKTLFRGRLFVCPNKAVHRNQDLKPACNFVDSEETKWYCYACLPGDSPVRTSTGIKEIQNISIGDIVFSMNGMSTKVVRKVKHLHAGKLIKVNTAIGTFPQQVTDNHNVPVIKSQEVMRLPFLRAESGRLSKFYGHIYNKTHNRKELCISREMAGDLKVGDYLLYPVDRKEASDTYINWDVREYTKGPKTTRSSGLPLNRETMFFFGLYVAEGNTYRGGIRITLHQSEIELQQAVLQFAKKYVGHGVGVTLRNNAWSGTISSTDLERGFRSLFNDLAENKSYPYLFNYLPRDLRESFFNGLMAGDGAGDKRIQLASKRAIGQLFDLAVSIGKIPTYSEQAAYVGSDGTKHGKTYRLYFQSRESVKAFHYDIEGVQYLCIKVLSLDVAPSSEVYDITVDHPTHSFLGFGYAMYNCGKTGDIFDAVHLLEGKPISGSGFHDTVEYLCKLLRVPYQISRDSNQEDEFIRDVGHFLSSMAKKGNDNLIKLIAEQPTHPAVEFLKSKGWLDSVERYNLGIIHNVGSSPSKKIKDICNFLNLELKDLTTGILIPIVFKQHNIGFQLRSFELDPKDRSKYRTYLSTQKGIFNLDGIDASAPVYVVEGASSVIVLNKFGITNVVATLGNGFSEANYESLVEREVKEIVVLYDNDSGGDIGRSRVCNVCVGKRDLKVGFKLLSVQNDPADYVLAGGDLEKLETVGMWEVLLQSKDKDMLLKFTAAQTDLIVKENMVNELSKLLGATKATLVEEIQKYEKDIPSVPTIMSLKEKESMINTVNDFEQWAWSRGSMLGMKSFQCFDTNFDGLQEGLILVSGNPNLGKSALMISTALQILNLNKDSYIVYITIDDSALATTARFVANLSGIPINIVSNPKHRIVENKYYTEDERRSLMARRERALEYLRNNVSMLNMKDAANGYTIEYLNTLLKSLEPIIKGKKPVLFIDNLHKLRSEREFKSDKALVDTICSNLKLISGAYKCPVICTVEHTKSAIQTGEVGGSAIKETSSLHYDANLIMTVTLKQVVGSFKLIDLVISKNKMSTFIGTLPFKLYPDLSKMEEMAVTTETITGSEPDDMDATEPEQ